MLLILNEPNLKEIIKKLNQWTDFFWQLNTIYFGVKIYLTAGICMILRFVKKCNGQVIALLYLINLKIFGAYTARKKNRLIQNIASIKKFLSVSTATNYTRRFKKIFSVVYFFAAKKFYVNPAIKIK